MLMELDYETVSALESALIVAEDSKMRDAKDSAILAQSLASRILLSSATISADSSADTVS